MAQPDERDATSGRGATGGDAATVVGPTLGVVPPPLVELVAACGGGYSFVVTRRDPCTCHTDIISRSHLAATAVAAAAGAGVAAGDGTTSSRTASIRPSGGRRWPSPPSVGQKHHRRRRRREPVVAAARGESAASWGWWSESREKLFVSGERTMVTREAGARRTRRKARNVRNRSSPARRGTKRPVHDGSVMARSVELGSGIDPTFFLHLGRCCLAERGVTQA